MDRDPNYCTNCGRGPFEILCHEPCLVCKTFAQDLACEAAFFHGMREAEHDGTVAGRILALRASNDPACGPLHDSVAAVDYLLSLPEP
jgi:hypothetical protein